MILTRPIYCLLHHPHSRFLEKTAKCIVSDVSLIKKTVFSNTLPSYFNSQCLHTSCYLNERSILRKFSKKDVKLLNLNDFETTEKFVQALSITEKEHLLKGLVNDQDNTHKGNFRNCFILN